MPLPNPSCEAPLEGAALLLTEKSRRWTVRPWVLVCSVLMLPIGLGALVHYANTWGVQTDDDNFTVRSDLKALETNLVRYKALAGSRPTQAQGLETLVTRPSGEPQPKSWMQFTSEHGITDPWGEPYQYRVTGRSKSAGYELFSKGPDKLEGTPDDIYN